MSPTDLAAEIAPIDARLAELLPPETDRPERLHAAMRYSALAPGKRIRPIMARYAAVAVGGRPDDALDAGCALELVHAFSLIHDDLPAIDNDDLRRGRPTCHVAFGENVAILAGDALFALAFQVVVATPHGGAQATDLAQAASGLVRGETLDVLSEGQPIDAATLEFIHRHKTAALFRASGRMGARAGGGTDTEIARLGEYGECVGLAFQIADDVLNVVGDEQALGKAVGSDAERQKATYPGLYGLDSAREQALEMVERALSTLDGLPGETLALRELARYAVRRMN
ncbi:MAG: polyprenyl synthetase family protein [Fimbriimonadaceae bacterium]|nr:polyprenyl synthetase family protein [Fimbriimonadaceae bacterium]